MGYQCKECQITCDYESTDPEKCGISFAHRPPASPGLFLLYLLLGWLLLRGGYINLFGIGLLGNLFGIGLLFIGLIATHDLIFCSWDDCCNFAKELGKLPSYLAQSGYDDWDACNQCKGRMKAAQEAKDAEAKAAAQAKPKAAAVAKKRRKNAKAAAAAVAKVTAAQEAQSVPNEYLCPITMAIMVDPVFTQDGHTYERVAIEDWLQQRQTSPKTNAPLSDKRLVENHALRALIGVWRESNRQ